MVRHGKMASLRWKAAALAGGRAAAGSTVRAYLQPAVAGDGQSQAARKKTATAMTAIGTILRVVDIEHLHRVNGLVGGCNGQAKRGAVSAGAQVRIECPGQ